MLQREPLNNLLAGDSDDDSVWLARRKPGAKEKRDCESIHKLAGKNKKHNHSGSCTLAPADRLLILVVIQHEPRSLEHQAIIKTKPKRKTI
jgi:hypothetical protein